jgi:AraC-like DNA-binding protein
VPIGEAIPSTIYRERMPTPSAASAVLGVWVQQVLAPGSIYEHRTVPSGCIDLAYVLGGDSITVVGPRLGPLVQYLEPGVCAVGVRLRAAAASAVLAAPASELVDLGIGLEHLWGRSARVLAEQVAVAVSPDAAASLIERAVATRLAGLSEPDWIISEAVRRLSLGHDVCLSDLTTELCISARQLRRRFDCALGYGPATLRRILRFQRFVALSRAAGDETSLARLSFAAGYADQAHLTRECVRLSGRTPQRFLGEMRRSCGADHDHGASLAERPSPTCPSPW